VRLQLDTFGGQERGDVVRIVPINLQNR